MMIFADAGSRFKDSRKEGPPCCAVDRCGGRQGENLIANEGRVVGRDRGANLRKTKTMTVTQTVAPPGLRKNGLRKYLGDAEGSTTNVPKRNATRHLLDIRNELESECI